MKHWPKSWSISLWNRINTLKIKKIQANFANFHRLSLVQSKMSVCKTVNCVFIRSSHCWKNQRIDSVRLWTLTISLSLPLAHNDFLVLYNPVTLWIRQCWVLFIFADWYKIVVSEQRILIVVLERRPNRDERFREKYDIVMF